MLRADLIMLQVYYGGAPGFARRIRAADAWWRARGAAHLRFSGPAWRGARPARAFARPLPNAPADWWALDNLSPGAARIIRTRAATPTASPPPA